jgi:hypothetical protein
VEAPDELTIHAVPHPHPRVRQVGFDLDHPYVEQCSVTVVGPSCTLLLRRLPVLWREGEPAVVNPSDLSRSLGLSGNTTSSANRLWRTIERLTQFGFAKRSPDASLEVYTQVAPLTPRALARVPDWSQRAHHRLLGEHLDRLAGTPPPSAGTSTARITERLDHLERPRSLAPPGLGR